MAEDPQQSARKQLLSSAAAGSAAFEISGMLELSEPLEVYFKDHNNKLGTVTFPLPGNDPTELQPLLDACSPAKFGLGRQTLHNEAVRKALQLPANRLGLNLPNALPSQAMMSDIKDLMMPEAGGLVRAEPYALNVYSPEEFTGGELIIRSPDLSTSVSHDWGSTSSARLAAAASSSSGCMLAWAAMHSDCEHEIKPITTGHRVTLTYNIYKPVSRCQDRGNEAAATAPAAAAAAARESAFGVQLAAALSDATWYPAGVTLGLALEHFYAAQTLDECEPRHSGYYSDEDYDDSRNMPDSIEPDSLKGADLQLYRAARAFGLEVMVVPVVSLEKFHKYDLMYLSDEEDGLSPLSPGKLAVMRSFKDHPGDGDSDTNGEWDGERYTDGESWEEYLQRNIAKRCAAQISGDLLWVKPPGKQHLKYCGNVSKYTGNSGVSTCYYVAGALLLMVPPVGAAARQG